ncbi:MAG TPA: phenylalanine--tRNA ligase beta subunit-related protein [Herpetosiphonaceae bacterium]
MVVVTLDPHVQQLLPKLLVGLVEAEQLRVQAHDAGLWSMLEELCEHLRFELKGKVAADHPHVAATRRAYRALGDDPTHYRPANEALLRRVLSHRALPQINVVVDINNYISLAHGFAVGCYDLAQIVGAAVVRRGEDGEQYEPIGKQAVDATNRLALADERGIFGSPTADSQRTMVTAETQRVLVAIFGFEAAQSAIDRAVDETAQLLSRFCGGQIVDRRVLAANEQ